MQTVRLHSSTPEHFLTISPPPANISEIRVFLIINGHFYISRTFLVIIEESRVHSRETTKAERRRRRLRIDAYYNIIIGFRGLLGLAVVVFVLVRTRLRGINGETMQRGVVDCLESVLQRVVVV